MRIIRSTAAALALATSLVGVGAWAQSGTSDTSGSNKPHAGATHKGAPTGATERQAGTKLSAADKTFFHNAYSDATAELAIGQLAKNSGATDKVKGLGETMVTNSTKQLDDLRKFAEKSGITAPSGMNAKNQEEVSKLSKLSGAQFDKAFLQHVEAREKTALGEMVKEAKTGTNPDLKSWASGEVATLKSTIDEARNIGVTEKQAAPTEKQPAPKQPQPKQPY
jgi:putative membrane protein